MFLSAYARKGYGMTNSILQPSNFFSRLDMPLIC